MKRPSMAVNPEREPSINMVILKVVVNPMLELERSMSLKRQPRSENYATSREKLTYNRRVKKAMKHLSAKAVEITEPQRTDDDDQTDENPIHSEDGAENSCSNKEAMATIRSHKVCHF